MMLKSIVFVGYNVEESSFLVNQNVDGKGRFKLSTSQLEISLHENSEDNTYNLIYPSNVSLIGYVNDDEEIFKATAKINLYFESENKIEPDFVDKNDWFFENFVHICLKNTFDDLLKNTSYSNLTIPSHRFTSS